jgi:hypothetical protein
MNISTLIVLVVAVLVVVFLVAQLTGCHSANPYEPIVNMPMAGACSTIVVKSLTQL